MAGNQSNGGILYKIAHFSTAYLNVPPNRHRLYNAVGLTAGIVAGRWGMNILTGSTLGGKKIDKEDVPAGLRPLHGILAYDHFSDDPKHRWMKIIDMMIPGILGGIGAGIGSDIFFKKDFLLPVEAKMTASARHFTLADAERRALYHQGRIWNGFSRLASTFGSASGFGLIPSWLNYSSTLGTKFTLDAERSAVMPWLGKTLRAKLINNHSLEPFRPTKLIGSMIEHLAGSARGLKTPQSFTDTAEGMLKTWFRDVTPQQIDIFKRNTLALRDHVVAEAKASHHTLGQTEAAVRKHLQHCFKDGQLEKRLIEAGIDPREAAIGDAGVVTTFARWIGDLTGRNTTDRIKAAQQLMIKGVELRHPELVTKTFTPADLTQSSTAAKLVAGAFLGTGAATVAAISTARDTGVSDLAPAAGATDVIPASFGQRIAQQQPAGKHVIHAKRERNFVDGHLLDAAEGITGMLNAAIGMHRVHCAAGLWLGSWFGDEVMKAMTGFTFAGTRVHKHELWKPLQAIYKILPFNPHSDLPKDKWMQIVRWGVPGIVGTASVIQGSKLFFRERYDRNKNAKYLDEMDDKAAMAQSEPWSYSSAISGLFGYPSGLPLLPLANYSTNLGSRFSIASNRKVALPIVGKWWSNNETLFPFGPPGMVDMLIKEAVNNRSVDPELLETYAIGVLKPWFDEVTPRQVEAFVGKVHEVRDRFFKEGGVPEEMKKQLESELKAHLKGAGLEETLEQVGLDPAAAHLGNNGLSGAIAGVLGAKKNVDKIQADYVQGYRERHARRRQQTDADFNLSA
ncbi:MAG: hypothetical protein KGJ21_02055 [Pseudomonadota bacterium]|nr:hypothetical protein [Pseudomonadota bacterium]